jgi:hypothetical protein
MISSSRRSMRALIPEKRSKMIQEKIPLPQGTQIPVTSVWNVRATHEFHISILDFVKDIKVSTTRPNGYLNLLEKTPHLQDKYETAIDQIYDE